MRKKNTEHASGRRAAAVILAVCMLLSTAPAVAATSTANAATDEALAAALADASIDSIHVTGNVNHTGDIGREVDITVEAGGVLTYHYLTIKASKVSTESLADITVGSGGKLVFFGDGKNNQYTTPRLIFRGDLTVEQGGTTEANQDGSWNGILLSYGNISNSGTITVKAVEGTTTPGGLYQAIDAVYTGTPVIGSYKRNLCRTIPVGGSIVTTTGATGGTGPDGAPKVGDVLYGTVDGYGTTDAATPVGAFTFRWLLNGVPQETGPSYTVPLSAVGKMCSVELFEIGADYVFFSVKNKVVKGHSKYNEGVSLGAVTMDTSERLYVGGTHGNDSNDGLTPEKALATANAAVLRAADGGTIVVCGNTAASAAKTLIENKTLTFTNIDGKEQYPNPILSMNRPFFGSNVTLQGVTWKQEGGNPYCAVGENATLKLDTVTPVNIQYIQGDAGARLVARDSTLTGVIGMLLAFDRIELDHSSATALEERSVFLNDTSDFVLKNGSTLSVSKNIGSLTCVGAGNILQASKRSVDPEPVPVPVPVAGPIKVDEGAPLALSTLWEMADERPFIQSGHESLTLDKFTLGDDGFALVKRDDTIYAATVVGSVSTLAPLNIGPTGAVLRGRAAPAEIAPESAAFDYWPVGNKGDKQTLPATVNSADNALSAALTGLTPDTEYACEAAATIAGKEYTGGTIYFRTAKENPPTGGIDVEVVGPNDDPLDVTVSIEAGNTVLAAHSGITKKDAPFSAHFSALPDGFYNIVVRTSSYTETRLTVVAGGKTEEQSFLIPSGTLSSVVKIKGEDTPPAAVDGLAELITPEDRTDATAGSKIEYTLTVEKKGEDAARADEIKTAAKAAGKVEELFYLDLSVSKTTVKEGAVTAAPIEQAGSILEIAFPIPTDLSGKTGLTVYRAHGPEEAAAMSKLDARQTAPVAEEGFYVDDRLGYIFIYAQRFSTYAVAYNIPFSGDSDTAYTITATAGEGGSVSPSGKVRVSYGGKKVFTITPDEGYEIADVLVDGKSVGAVSGYAFQSVKAGHTIAATFQKADNKAAWNPFEDVHEDDWFHHEVKYVYENSLILGTSGTTFSPYLDTSRGMIVTILWRMESSPKASKAAAFSDVASGQYYSDAVAWGAENGIVLGYDTGLFGPADPITREQLAAILWRYAKYRGWDVSVGEDTNILSYSDYARASEYAVPALQWACGAGIIAGKGGGILAPAGHATRAETAAMLERFSTGEREPTGAAPGV